MTGLQIEVPAIPPVEVTGNHCGRIAAQIIGTRTGPEAKPREKIMPEYIPSPSDWVREQVELYESSGGTKGLTLRDTGLPVIIVTNTGRNSGAIRKTPLMRVADGDNYVLVASKGGAPKHPVWYYNLKAESNVQIQDATEKYDMRVREVYDPTEKARLWVLAVAAYPPYQDYQDKAGRAIPVFIAEPIS